MTQTPTSSLRIVAVDKIAEVVTIQNTGATSLDLTGWTICSLLGHQRHAQLIGTLAAGATQAVPSEAGRAIWNNRAAESSAVYIDVGSLGAYWSETP